MWGIKKEGSPNKSDLWAIWHSQVGPTSHVPRPTSQHTTTQQQHCSSFACLHSLSKFLPLKLNALPLLTSQNHTNIDNNSPNFSSNFYPYNLKTSKYVVPPLILGPLSQFLNCQSLNFKILLFYFLNSSFVSIWILHFNGLTLIFLLLNIYFSFWH